MNTHMRMLLAAVAVSVLPVANHAQTAIERVSWLQGCWRLSSNGRTVDEQWMAPGGGAMLSIGRTVRDGTLVEYEFVVVREREGALVYIAHPSGQAPAEFPLKAVDAESVVFENAAHDFPQRVGYRRRANGLDAWIEGTINGSPRRVDFPYARVACPAQ